VCGFSSSFCMDPHYPAPDLKQDWMGCAHNYSVFLHFSVALIQIYLFIYSAYPVQGHTGGLEPIPAHTGREAYTLDRSPDYYRADTEKQATIHAHIQTCEQFTHYLT